MKVVDEEAGEVRLHCHSPKREEKENGINRRFCERFEAGLASPRGEKRPALVQERIGKLKQRSFWVGRHYEITLEMNAEGSTVTRLSWEQKRRCLRRMAAPTTTTLARAPASAARSP